MSLLGQHRMSEALLPLQGSNASKHQSIGGASMSDDQAIKSRVLNKPLPHEDYLRACFAYDPDTGTLTWKERPREHFTTEQAWLVFNNKRAGTAAGWVGDKKGYYRVTVNGCDYKVARVIWKLMTGEDPLHEVDHKDRDCTNNRWSNLRSASAREQSYNRVRGDNRTGHRGVVAHGRHWRAMIKVDGVVWSSSYFDTPEEAAANYEVMAKKIHGAFYIHPSPQNRGE